MPRASAKQLQGNLQFFDLATVIQTLIGSHQTGNLVVTQDGGKQKVAEIFFFKGNIATRQGQAPHRATTPSSSSSSRRSRASSPSPGGRSQEEEVQTDITMPAISLLMESVRLQDELPLLQARIPDPDARLPPEGGAARSGRTRTPSSWRPRCGRGSRRARR